MQYIPGQCNINREEISRRYRIGAVGLALVILAIAIIEGSGLPRVARLLIIIPLGASIAGFVQARSKFCLAFGFLGVFSSPGTSRVERTLESEARRLDRQMAMRLLLITAILTLILTAIYYFLPHNQ